MYTRNLTILHIVLRMYLYSQYSMQNRQIPCTICIQWWNRYCRFSVQQAYVFSGIGTFSVEQVHCQYNMYSVVEQVHSLYNMYSVEQVHSQYNIVGVFSSDGWFKHFKQPHLAETHFNHQGVLQFFKRHKLSKREASL